MVPLFIDQGGGSFLIAEQHIQQIDEGIALAFQRDPVAVKKRSVNPKSGFFGFVLPKIP